MTTITIPKDGASDKYVTVSELNFNDGDQVTIGDVLLVYETSKATYELDTDVSGYVYYFVNENDKAEVGSAVMILSDAVLDNEQLNDLKSAQKQVEEKQYDNKVVSKKASRLIEEHQIDIALFSEEIITEALILNYINTKDKTFNTEYQFSENDIVIIGAGGHAGMCYDIVKYDSRYTLVGFIDDNITQFKLDEKLVYFGTISNVTALKERGLKKVILGIGFINSLAKRDALYKELIQSFEIPTITHRSAIIESSATVLGGCQIMAGAIIGSNVVVKSNCIINSGSIVSHDTTIEQSVHITPGVILAGHIAIGSRTIIGMGSTVFIGVTIGQDVVINNGLSIFKNIDDFSTIKQNE